VSAGHRAWRIVGGTIKAPLSRSERRSLPHRLSPRCVPSDEARHGAVPSHPCMQYVVMRVPFRGVPRDTSLSPRKGPVGRRRDVRPEPIDVNDLDRPTGPREPDGRIVRRSSLRRDAPSAHRDDDASTLSGKSISQLFAFPLAFPRRCRLMARGSVGSPAIDFFSFPRAAARIG